MGTLTPKLNPKHAQLIDIRALFGTLWQSFQDLSKTMPRGPSGAPEAGLMGTLNPKP